MRRVTRRYPHHFQHASSAVARTGVKMCCVKIIRVFGDCGDDIQLEINDNQNVVSMLMHQT